MILLIDNYDSFVYNLYQALGTLDENIKVVRNDEISAEDIASMGITHIVLSPGPGKPEDAGICAEVVKQYQGKIPILGVCLGHQVIAEVYGGTVSYAKEIVHGKQAELLIEANNPLFKGLGNRMGGARYHSLAIKQETMPKCLEVIASTNDDMPEIMAVAHKEYPVYGLQFHPESILTPEGMQILDNFLKMEV